MKLSIAFRYFCLSALILLVTCKKEDNIYMNVDFPLFEGNNWTYNRIFNLIHDSSQGNEGSFLDTTIIINFNVFVKYDQDFYGSPHYEVICSGQYDRYLNTAEGLKLWTGFLSSPGLNNAHLFPVRVDKETGWWIDKVQEKNSQFDSLDSYELVLKYPLEIGSEWISQPYINEENPEVRKTVIGKEEVHVSAGMFDCYLIKTIYPFNDSSYTLDFIDTAFGLIKRESKIYNMTVVVYEFYDYNNPNDYAEKGSYIVNIEDNWELEKYHIEK